MVFELVGKEVGYIGGKIERGNNDSYNANKINSFQILGSFWMLQHINMKI
jgi:hypothetical protein